MYVDVILPVPLNSMFTYLLPDGMPHVERGMRVLVPFGKTKTYIGIVAGCREESKDNGGGKASFTIKPVIEVLDTKPSVTENQFKIWQWISEYYIAPLGDVYKAAMPSGLKVEDNYKPKTEVCVRLAAKLLNEKTQHLALETLARAKSQHKALSVLIDNLPGHSGNPGTSGVSRIPVHPIHYDLTRDELINLSGTNTTTIKQLADKGFVEIYEREVCRLNTQTQYNPEVINPLNEHQQKAYEEIKESFGKHNVTLLHGITSSGKTEIYIHLIKEQIEQGRQVLYLLPEIALTVQIMQRLQRVFGKRMGIYHSKYSDAERVEVWRKQLSDEPFDVILGVRSSVFLPFNNLGLVIIDEEHETSYKQQDPSPRYHARSVAIMLAQMYGAKTLLGTATPSMESMYNAKMGKFGMVTLNVRYKNIRLPEICVVDAKDLQRRKIMRTPFSPLLTESIREALANGEQVILFQNRRGFNSMIECKDCGWVPKCSSCDVSLTYHKEYDNDNDNENDNLQPSTLNPHPFKTLTPHPSPLTPHLNCHYCGRTYRIPEKCPICGSKHLRGKGTGTEKIEEYVHQLFPEARVARMDLDTTRSRTAYERIISDFSSGQTNMLIGTQMISKGLDFDRVSVVGIIDADTMLNYPDFRAYEQAFMMMTQVSGRAGRKGKQGKVILQTKNADLPLIQQIVGNDYKAFFEATLSERQTFHYPPFYHIIYIYVKHRQVDAVEKASYELAEKFRRTLGERVLGPDKPAVAKVRALHIRKIMLKLENRLSLAAVRKTILSAQDELLQSNHYPSLQIYYDVDPM